jgi:hypothetical protein
MLCCSYLFLFYLSIYGLRKQDSLSLFLSLFGVFIHACNISLLVNYCGILLRVVLVRDQFLVLTCLLKDGLNISDLKSSSFRCQERFIEISQICRI